METKTKTKHVIERKISCDTIGREITSRITGKLVGFDDLFDAKTKTFKTEDELKALGAVFITVDLDKVITDTDCVKKSRITKETQEAKHCTQMYS